MKIKIIEYSDWIEIYVDDKKYEGHIPRYDQVLDLLGIKYEYEYREEYP